MTIATRGPNEWLVPSQTKPGEIYIVKRVAGALSCDCPAGFFRGRCKHSTAVAATLPQRGPSAAATGDLFLAPHRRRVAA